MADADAPFLAAICAAPDDLLPQGLYLDWLSEQPGRWGDWLLRRVLLDPGDDGVRLEYARWLEAGAGAVECPECRGHGELVAWCEIIKENDREVCPACRGSGTASDGRAERAEFIRVQVEIAALTDSCTQDHCQCPRCIRVAALRRRERELLLSHWRAWVPMIGPRETYEVILSPRWNFTGQPAVEFRRGFPDRLVCTAEQFLKHAAAVFGAAPVTSVVLAEKEPVGLAVTPGWVWYLGHDRFSGSAWLPRQLWADLPARRKTDDTAFYDSREDALSALSAVALEFGRRAAGLPAWGPAREKAHRLRRVG